MAHLPLRILSQLNLNPLPGKGSGDVAQKAWNTSLTIIAVTLSVVAVLMVVINGFKYITSAGDPQKMSKARKGLLYSIIGLLVIWTAKIIVSWIIRGLM